MTSVLSRGRVPRGGRRPGWTMLTVLLVLAIVASSALVFTSRVELLKLAVIMALWAAVVAAFVSVIYRRQSDVDQARARDLKLVYDLQLDREISARREYELTVESQLRRELASELRAQAADEVAALRAELSALRTNLEILFDADLSHRPAIEPERTTVRAYSDWARNESTTETRVIPVTPPAAPAAGGSADNPIIDVPEVRIPTGGIPIPPAPWQQDGDGARTASGAHRGSHRRAADEAPQPSVGAGRWAQPAQPYIAPAAPAPRSEPKPPPVAPPAPAAAWKPVGAEGAWLPPGAPGSNWTADAAPESAPAAFAEPMPRPGRGRHAGPSESVEAPVNGAEPLQPQRAGGRRRADARPPVEAPAQPVADSGGRHAGPAPAAAAAPAPPVVSRHGTADGSESEPGGQSVADLLARLQPEPAEGRHQSRRRRRAE